MHSREIRLASRPQGTPTEENFELAEVDVPAPTDGEVLVENHYLSVDPYMRGRMSDRESYVPPFEVGAPLEGGAVGRVVQSAGTDVAEGALVLTQKGWRERFTAPASEVQVLDVAEGVPPQAFLGVLGMPGLTAYVGLLEVAEPQEGETVFVSGAAGAVGSVVCQIARLKGCRVVGSAGSDEKTRWLEETAGVDATINYKEVGNLHRALAQAAPNGVDVYFDNVGSDHLEAALGAMNDFGRVAMCGAIAQYNATEPPCAPRNLAMVIQKRLRLEGFIVSDHQDAQPQFVEDMSGWIRGGQVQWEETIVDGLEQAPEAFLGLFEGDNLGKMIVRLEAANG